ncbi:MAG: Uma2 family endonuclease [Lachnospiraceae bacterium]|nr:Uma2 family endonuclease [Lachnospiraceae bacterium]
MDNMMEKEIYTIEDVLNTEEHAELIGGNLVIINYTSPAHNSVVGDMYLSFREFIKKNNGNCKVFSENVALFCNELSDETKNEFYLPDLMVVCDEEGIKDDGVHTAPLFVAEVTSDSTRKYDYTNKMITYRDIGVKEYWIIDIQKKMVTKYLIDDDYAPITYLHPDNVSVSVYDGELVIDFSEMF